MTVTQLCPTLCNYIVHGILKARILEWVAVPSPGDLPNSGIKLRYPGLQADSSPSEPQQKPNREEKSASKTKEYILNSDGRIHVYIEGICLEVTEGASTVKRHTYYSVLY